MFLLKFIMNMIKVLGSETSPASIACALCIGMILGFNPLLSIQGIVLLLVVLFFKVNIAAFIFSLLLSKAVFFVIGGLVEPLGASLLEAESLNGLWTSLYNSVLYYTWFNNALHLGGMFLSAICCVPMYIACLYGIKWYRHVLEPKLRNSKMVKAMKANKLYKMYKAMTTPIGGVD